MPILPENLDIRFEADLVLNGGFVLVYQYEIFHKEWIPDTTIETGTIWQRISNLSQIASADTALQSRLKATLQGSRDRYRAIGATGYSLHDTDLIWQHWLFSQLTSGNLKAEHPLSGEFSGAAENTPVGRTVALTSIVPGPPSWTWADSPGPGQLRVKCVAVPGADHYDVYHDEGGGEFELLGQVADAGLNTISVSGGDYTVRLAAVAANGRIGILSVPVPVSVDVLQGLMMDAPVMGESAPELETLELVEDEPEPELTRGDRLVRWLWGPNRYDETT